MSMAVTYAKARIKLYQEGIAVMSEQCGNDRDSREIMSKWISDAQAQVDQDKKIVADSQ